MKKAIKWLLIGFVKLYQAMLSPLLPIACRYHPTCSEYAIQAIQEHGVWKGFYLAIKRISRCHPWGGKGYDPVPKKVKISIKE